MHSNVAVPAKGDHTEGWASVMTLVYRDRINGVKFTAHWREDVGYGWITQHAPMAPNDSDGRAVYRSNRYMTWEGLNRAWNETRADLTPDRCRSHPSFEPDNCPACGTETKLT